MLWSATQSETHDSMQERLSMLPDKRNTRDKRATRRHRLCGAFVALFVVFPAHSQESGQEPSASELPLFADDALLEVTIEAPLTTLIDERPDEGYLDGIFRFTADDQSERVLGLKLRTRGKYRRDKEHCDFPPIRLNFSTAEVVGTVFAGQDKLKMVTHCRTRNYKYERFVLREYLAYRILNLLTSKSYRVRLMRINYVDTEGGKPITKLGFVIEDDEHVAARNGMQIVKTGNISLDDLDREQQSLVDMFQYMIGNTEYSLHISEPDDDCCHNSDLMSVTGSAPYTPLAYDFDFAGIVNAPYAEPNPKYRLRHVRQRLYKGQCRNNDLLPGTIERFLDTRDAVYALIDQLEPLSVESRKHLFRFLNLFYKRISDPKSVHRRFENKCQENP